MEEGSGDLVFVSLIPSSLNKSKLKGVKEAKQAASGDFKKGQMIKNARRNNTNQNTLYLEAEGEKFAVYLADKEGKINEKAVRAILDLFDDPPSKDDLLADLSDNSSKSFEFDLKLLDRTKAKRTHSSIK